MTPSRRRHVRRRGGQLSLVDGHRWPEPGDVVQRLAEPGSPAHRLQPTRRRPVCLVTINGYPSTQVPHIGALPGLQIRALSRENRANHSTRGVLLGDHIRPAQSSVDRTPGRHLCRRLIGSYRYILPRQMWSATYLSGVCLYTAAERSSCVPDRVSETSERPRLVTCGNSRA